MDLSFKKKLFIVLIHTIEVKLVQESISSTIDSTYN